MVQRTRLKSARIRRGLTMKEAAQAAGVKYGVIQAWEARTHAPRADHVMRVAEEFGLTLEDLFHDFEVQRVPREEVSIA